MSDLFFAGEAPIRAMDYFFQAVDIFGNGIILNMLPGYICRAKLLFQSIKGKKKIEMQLNAGGSWVPREEGKIGVSLKRPRLVR